MANMLVIFGLVTYATKGVSFGAIEPAIPKMIIPKINGFPTIILWAVAAIVIVWFIWNKTTFGKNLYAVGGNPEAAAVSGISVFGVTMGAFLLAGGAKGKRMALPNAEIMIHQPSGGAQGQATEIDIVAQQILKTRHKLNSILAQNTGQTLETIARDTERDNYMTAQEAMAYGLIDSVIEHR